jgi:nucleotide-binding universal stress UspA family protein
MYNKILVPVDGSELAECVLPHVINIATGCGGGTVIFVRVIEPLDRAATIDGAALNPEITKRIIEDSLNSAKNYLKGLEQRIGNKAGDIKTEVLHGKAAEEIINYADKNSVDLIIIATHGRSGVSRWVWGSVADRVIRHSRAPVFIVRAPGCIPGEK